MRQFRLKSKRTFRPRNFIGALQIFILLLIITSFQNCAAPFEVAQTIDSSSLLPQGQNTETDSTRETTETTDTTDPSAPPTTSANPINPSIPTTPSVPTTPTPTPTPPPPITDPPPTNRTCMKGLKLGTQGLSNGIWGSCVTCDSGYTSWEGACYTNTSFAKDYASSLTKCWQDGAIQCGGSALQGFIGLPSKWQATSADTIAFQIKYKGASSVTLTPDMITLHSVGVANCLKSVTGSGATLRTVSLSGCTGAGKLNISIADGSARDNAGLTLKKFGPSTDVFITNLNNNGYPKVSFGDDYLGTYKGVNGNNITYAMYYPKDFASRTNIPVFVHIHGGGWSGGDYTSDASVARAVAELGFLVFNVNYTLATPNPANYPANYPNLVLPTSPYSLGPNDIQEFIKFLQANLQLVNGDKNNISISGSSAGGHLALHQATRPDNTTQFKCVIPMAGPADLVSLQSGKNFPATAFIVSSIFGNSLSVLQNNSPKYNAANFKGSKFAVLHQVQDNLVPLEQAMQISNRLKTLFPNLDMTINYANDNNTYPVMNASPEQLTHVYGNSFPVEALKAYVHTHCR